MREVIVVLKPVGNFLKLAVIARLVLSILFPLFLYLKIRKLSARIFLGLYLPPPVKCLLAVIGGFVTILGINFLLPRLIPPSPQLVHVSQSLTAYGNSGEFLLSFLTVVIFASVTDELFFRGLLLRTLMIRYGKYAAIFTTAMLTALFHTLEPFKLIHAFLMGLIFATAVIWTNSVYTAIILHSLHNALALLPQ